MNKAIQSFHRMLVESEGLLRHLAHQDGTVRIHRGSVPYHKAYAALYELSPNDPEYSLIRSKHLIPPHIWYNVGSVAYTQCLSGVSYVESYRIDLEIVSFDLNILDEIDCALFKTITDTQQLLVPNCLLPVSHGECDYDFEDLEIVSASEDYEPTNSIAVTLGGFIKSYRLTITPKSG